MANTVNAAPSGTAKKSAVPAPSGTARRLAEKDSGKDSARRLAEKDSGKDSDRKLAKKPFKMTWNIGNIHRDDVYFCSLKIKTGRSIRVLNSVWQSVKGTPEVKALLSNNHISVK